MLERAALNFVESLGLDQIFRAEDPEQLAHIHFWHEYAAIARQHLAQIFRKRIEMAQMNVADAPACPSLRCEGGSDGAVRGAPSNDQQIAIGIAGRNSVGNILHDGFNFRRAQTDHRLVVERLVIDVA